MNVFLVNNGSVSFIGQAEDSFTTDDNGVTLTKAVHINDVLLPGKPTTVGGEISPGRPTRIQVISNISTFDTVQPSVTIKNISYVAPITADMEFYKIYEGLLAQASGLVTEADDQTKKLVT